MPKTSLQQQITVHALPSKVWKVLTAPEYINQYCHQENLQSAWVEGSSIRTRKEFAELEEPVGRVLDAVPGIFLKFTMAEEGRDNPVIISYELIITGDGVDLKLKSEGFEATQQEFTYRIQQARLTLQKIKWLSEYS